MGWLLRLFDRIRQGPTVAKSAAENADSLDGWKFAASMKASTPLEWLLRHGEVANVRSGVPRKFGVWVPVTKSSRKPVFLKEQSPPSTMASQVGQIPQDGGEFLPFLIEYRRIVETPDNGLNSLRIEALKERYPQYAIVLEPKPKRKKRKARR